MPGLIDLVQWVQAGINCSHHPAFVQDFPPFSTPNPIVEEDVTMRDSSPAPDIANNNWDQLRTVAPDFLAKDICGLTSREAALLYDLIQQHNAQQGKADQDDVKPSCSLVDEHMKSPPPEDRPYPDPQSYSVPDVESQLPCGANSPHSMEEPEILANVSAFAGVRHHPYARFDIDNSTPGHLPNWVKKRASRQTMADREARRFKEMPVQKEPEFVGDRQWQSKLEMKRSELLCQARARIEEAGGVWDEAVFLERYAGHLQETAEQLVREDDDANRQRDTHGNYFAQAIEFINAIHKYQAVEQKELEESIQEKLGAVDELDKAIDDLRRELKMLKMQREEYPESREELYEALWASATAKAKADRRQAELLTFLQSSMEQNGQDFFTAWRAFQVHFSLPSGVWPTGIIPPTVPPPPSPEPSPPLASTSSAPPSPDLVPENPIPTTSPVPNTPNPPVSASALSSDAVPPSPCTTPFSYKFLPVRKPRTDTERTIRYTDDWALLKSGHLVDGNATFEQVPWPVFFNLDRDHLDQLTLESVRAFVLCPDRLDAKSPLKVLNNELLRWHEDKLTAVLRKFVPGDRSTILAACRQIAMILVEIRDSL
ncbi:hypothetical protein P691DRAFT_780744 [Macrolepiota fuliginosa MF-IS2]|uniref:Uncharacterized protein n=1 Tax=Macrolepiota fuliginosa MF-IS2 TaxID=1400762 RepID=A0A9P5XEE4_9AGAR|nr:hypothetical protein P691DRAFT_780744 [Macrolepiota fuliginosa MF-IS2]